jgi:hypothetical protein
MTDLAALARSIPASVSRFASRSVTQVLSWRSRRADARARAICPVDSWTFTPLYTNGSCPLCGWKPEGYAYAPPALAPYDRYWGALAGIAGVSVVMCIAVLVAYTRV